MLDPSLEKGSFHYFQYLKWSKECLTEELWELISDCFSHKSYFAHPENLLYCILMSSSSSDIDKETALNLILEFRDVQKKSRAKTVRKFIPPTGLEMNFEAENLIILKKLFTSF